MGNQKAKPTQTTEAVRETSAPHFVKLRESGRTAEHPILQLRRSLGNQAIQRLLSSSLVQAKLKVNQPGDMYEQEADRVAEQVMQMPEPRIQRQLEEDEEEKVQTKPLSEQITPLVQRQADQAKEEEEEDALMPKATPGQAAAVSHGLESQVNTLKGGGQPLPESARTFFEPRFGYDFSKVRVHNDGQAAETARAMNAQAYTVGRDVVFGAGKYAPETAEGKRLLAHELAHVVQQGEVSSLDTTLKVSSPDAAAVLQTVEPRPINSPTRQSMFAHLVPANNHLLMQPESSPESGKETSPGEELIKKLQDLGLTEGTISGILEEIKPGEIAHALEALEVLLGEGFFLGTPLWAAAIFVLAILEILSLFEELSNKKEILTSIACKATAYGITAWAFGDEYQELPVNDRQALKLLVSWKENWMEDAEKCWHESREKAIDAMVQKYIKLKIPKHVFTALLRSQFDNDRKKMARSLHDALFEAVPFLPPGLQELYGTLLKIDYPD